MKACLKLQPDVLFQRIPTYFKIALLSFILWRSQITVFWRWYFFLLFTCNSSLKVLSMIRFRLRSRYSELLVESVISGIFKIIYVRICSSMLQTALECNRGRRYYSSVVMARNKMNNYCGFYSRTESSDSGKGGKTIPVYILPPKYGSFFEVFNSIRQL